MNFNTSASFRYSMGNNTAIPLQGEILFANQLELVVPTTVAGTLYGIAFTFFCLYVHALGPQLRDGDRKRHAQFMLGYSAVIMLCGLYDLVANAWVTQDAYIKHSDYLGSPYSYILSAYHTSRVMFIGGFCQVAVDILTSAIQVHSHFSLVCPTTRLSSGQDLACVDHLECD
jgi:hypothetical protein